MDTLNTFQRFVGDAATNLGVTSGFRTSTTEVVDWEENKNPPSDDALNAEIDRLKAEYDANQYQRDRHYPTWQEQMDMQYHDELDGTTTWKDAVAKVKADNPKP